MLLMLLVAGDHRARLHVLDVRVLLHILALRLKPVDPLRGDVKIPSARDHDARVAPQEPHERQAHGLEERLLTIRIENPATIARCVWLASTGPLRKGSVAHVDLFGGKGGRFYHSEVDVNQIYLLMRFGLLARCICVLKALFQFPNITTR